uniref:Uncharacterized protein n=1 Tax=Fervidobacterium pennivorans TaxID=93466 RepID=A0A7V4KEY1_FERPE
MKIKVNDKIAKLPPDTISPYHTVFADIVLEIIHLFVLKAIKENLSWIEAIKLVYQLFDLPEVIPWNKAKDLLKTDIKLYSKLAKKRMRKFLIPSDLKDVLIETRVLYLYLLTLFPKPFARLLAYDYAFFHPSMQKYPFAITTSLIADALSLKRHFYEYTTANLKNAFERLKITGPLRGVEIEFEDLFRIEEEEAKAIE